MAKEIKTFSKESLLETVEEFRKDNKVNKSLLTFDWMDNFVAKICPDRIDEYSKACAKIQKVTKKNETGTVKNIKEVREYFLKTFLPDLTDEAIEERKEQERLAKLKAKEEAKKEKERLANLSVEEQIKERLKKLIEE